MLVGKSTGTYEAYWQGALGTSTWGMAEGLILATSAR